MTEGLHHVAIIVSDREKSLEFYGFLGFEKTSSYVRPERNDEVITVKNGETVLELFVSKGNPERPSYPEAYGLRHIAFKAKDVRELARKADALGIAHEEIRIDSFDGKRVLFIKDPDGLPVELHE